MKSEGIKKIVKIVRGCPLQALTKSGETPIPAEPGQEDDLMEKKGMTKKDLVHISFTVGQVIFPLPFSVLIATKLLKNLPDIFPFLDKQGEIKKVDEEFFVNIIKAGKESGVSELNLEFSRDQITGLDTTISKVKGKVGFDFDFGIKGTTDVTLNIKYK